MGEIVYFGWFIRNPFLPFNKVEETFYSNLPDIVEWKVTLQPIRRSFHRSFHRRFFTFSLEGKKCYQTTSFLTKRVVVTVYTKGERVTTEQQENYEFGGELQPYSFQTHADTRPTEEELQDLDTANLVSLEKLSLIIQVQIHFPERHRPLSTPETSPSLEDLLQLSRDLENLFDFPLYTDLVLIPNEGDLSHVHSYIIDSRWRNLIKTRRPEDGDVRTNISADLLEKILRFMYSGKFPMNIPDGNDVPYTTELFQVIDQYQMYHLYKVFFRRDMRQYRETRKHLCTAPFLFHFKPGYLSFNWYAVLGTEHNVSFHIEILMDGRGPRLAYSLELTSDLDIHAQVNLACIRNGQPVWVHEEDFDMIPTEIQNSEVSSEENALIFEDFDANERHLFICCVLRLSDGTIVRGVENMVTRARENEEERLVILSDCLKSLYRRTQSGKIASDLKIRCDADFSDEKYIYNLHKGFLAARVPNYWRVFKTFPQHIGLPVELLRDGGDLPDMIQTDDLKRRALDFLLPYIYSCELTERHVPNEVIAFAEKIEHAALQGLINRINPGYQ